VKLRLLLLSLVVLATGCRAHKTFFRGVDRAIYEETELEELEPASAAELAAEAARQAQQAADAEAAQEAQRAADEAAATEEATGPAEVTSAVPAAEHWLEGVRLTDDGLQGRAEWSRDGKRIVFQSVRAADKGANPWEQVYLMNSAGEGQLRVTAGVGKTHGAVLVPNTSDLVIAYASTAHTGATPPRDSVAVGDSADHDMELVLQNLTSGATRMLAQGPGFDGEPHFCTPEDYVFASARTGDLEIYRQTGSVRTRITERPGADESPRLSIDCRLLVWVRRTPEGSELVVRRDGTDTVALSVPAGIHTPAFSRLASHVVFSSDLAEPGGPLELFSLELHSGTLRRLTASDASERAPRVRPDGAALLYSSDAEGTPQLYVAPWAEDVGTVWSVGPSKGTP